MLNEIKEMAQKQKFGIERFYEGKEVMVKENKITIDFDQSIQLFLKQFHSYNQQNYIIVLEIKLKSFQMQGEIDFFFIERM
ncbi:unnamed protein product (macronuclear) [Paramecium tetraurelia]|uniref:Uncharacterized protein n=1 Tax=Paramecium tetraurelia TaxID=5888 RepID=A0CBS2_PARTE|nr:uncharacterized protein GSPATT00037022001 [Paramecium tetraurelia]CAK68239.1 unnamed protein product [Paramecium tetraurelia]|eukprot:XP_001435636.1 hypothetical protein (macronuclear) [Paramecium tetraurelia strain d4-2]